MPGATAPLQPICRGPGSVGDEFRAGNRNKGQERGLFGDRRKSLRDKSDDDPAAGLVRTCVLRIDGASSRPGGRGPPAVPVIGYNRAMFTKLDHVGIAVRSLSGALPAFEAALGGTATAPEEVADQKVNVVFIRTGEAGIELLESTSPEGPIGRFVEKRGEGIHHLSFLVDDLEKALDRCRAAGIRLIDETPRRGAEGKRIAFLHPKSTNGVLIELSEKDHARSS